MNWKTVIAYVNSGKTLEDKVFRWMEKNAPASYEVAKGQKQLNGSDHTNYSRMKKLVKVLTYFLDADEKNMFITLDQKKDDVTESEWSSHLDRLIKNGTSKIVSIASKNGWSEKGKPIKKLTKTTFHSISKRLFEHLGLTD